ncbi:enterochelin esterase [[Enterobacter] lignolyticus]|uniref:Enterobactin esterase n=1 Tax=[Enterobacter] lignolyticus TaxID=1334193 RepID=A0A806X3N3_9ENTR|nr:enterochelin esterase [[Enterobacter] lignolyticus]ALR75908.1 enterobactin esterase [[Enterobacter] lignolyticus]
MAETVTTGSNAWWARKRGPEWRQEGELCHVTFWWRDPAGSERTSPVQRVWIYITGVTDHHQHAVPQSLERLAGTDVWRWQTTLPASWRGSYCLIPSLRTDDFPADVFRSARPDSAGLREGWRALLPQAIADPLNPHSWRGGRGHPVSALSLPLSPPQPGWQTPDALYSPPLCIDWRSRHLGNTRRVWIFTTGSDMPAERPLAVLLDGQFWAESMPVWPALASLTREGQLPPAVYLLIDAIDTPHRSAELPCNADFWLALQQELLPQVQSLAPFSDRGEHTVVAGQSFGGLAAMFAGLHWPQRFGCVLSQSGSFWWPTRGAQPGGALVDRLARRELSPGNLRIWLEAGVREPMIFQANQALLQQLQQAQQPVFWRQVDGGHDALCWRGGLTAGLIQLWLPLRESRA